MSVRIALTLAGLLAAIAQPSLGKPDAHQMDHAAHMAQMEKPAPKTRAAMPPAVKPVLVRFPTQLRDHTLSNMRDHLLALAEIQERLAQQRYDAAAEIAEQRLGMSSLQLHGAHEVAKYMPKGMQEAGTAMHRAASRFALTAQESSIDRDLGKSLATLATLTQTCVACHAGYRLR
ncbi:MAG: hypothetical protein K9K30_12190 [Burkholderiaceae bacterium]|nr:hypothetical protein [Sulfuritalea sp.]MCF8175989.1 hypothetical protein [Burkholderiaceae bacterium]MCF8183663.1 hypothetical protein [Polynucleobacter sp.]